MPHRIAVALCLLSAAGSLAGQATTTANRRFDLQVGVGVVGASSDYRPEKFKGGALYATLDVTNHWGAEFVIHQVYTPGNDNVGERTYELGGRYHRTYGRFAPYAKAMYGRGVFNYPFNVANLAYNLFAVGGGTDFALFSHVNLRADYEYQHWLSFPPNGLTPQLVTIGVAYHFPGLLGRGARFK